LIIIEGIPPLTPFGRDDTGGSIKRWT